MVFFAFVGFKVSQQALYIVMILYQSCPCDSVMLHRLWWVVILMSCACWVIAFPLRPCKLFGVFPLV